MQFKLLRPPALCLTPLLLLRKVRFYYSCQFIGYWLYLAKTGACLGCHTQKIACIFAPNATICNKCAKGNCPGECIIQESSTRSCSTSAPPSIISSESSTRRRPLTTTTSGENSLPDKRLAFGSTDIIPNAKRARRAPSEDPVATRARCAPLEDHIVTKAHVAPAGDLTMISELDELGGLDRSFPNDLLPDAGEFAGEIMSVLTGHSGTIEFNLEKEHKEDKMNEDRTAGTTGTIDKDQQSNLEIGSETDNGMHKLCQKHSSQTVQHVPAKWALPIKSVGKGKGKGKAVPKLPSPDCYDPDTCSKLHSLYSMCMYILTHFLHQSSRSSVLFSDSMDQNRQMSLSR